LDQVEKTKFEVRTRKLYTKLKLDSLDNYDTEFIDLDFLISQYIGEFTTQKRLLGKKL